jgi:protein-S-isoprenylcysteine O-methyltransferase Ste14
VFTVLILGRPVLVTALAWANRGTAPLDGTVAAVLAVLCALPGAYLAYSIRRYFSFRRAFGIDHFDPAYRSAPLVREGIFRYSANAMYVYGFLVLWVPGLALRSTAALFVALFSHIYIWVHHAFTEKPDMNRIYAR